MLNGYIENKQYDKAWKLFESMKKENIYILDEVTYTIMIKACEKV